MSWKRIPHPPVPGDPYSPASAHARRPSGGGNESNNRREAPATVAGAKWSMRLRYSDFSTPNTSEKVTLLELFFFFARSANDGSVLLSKVSELDKTRQSGLISRKKKREKLTTAANQERRREKKAPRVRR